MVFASLHERSRHLIKNAQSIVKNFEKADEMTRNIQVENLMDEQELESAAEQVQKILTAGKNIGLRKVEALLGGKGLATIEVLKEEEGIDDEFYGDTADEGGKGWGYVAKRMDRAAKKMAKSFAVPLRIEN